jgi:RNA polymerase sigma-70 factor (ECF subfamily)
MKNSELARDLLYRISQDDSAAFTQLFDLYLSKVLQVAGYFIKSDEICHEVTSDVFLIIWNNRRKLVDIENFDAYIYTITKNKSFDYLDKRSREPDFLQVPLEINSLINNPEVELLCKEAENLVNKSIQELPPRCREVFIMAREEGFKYHEIAKILSISEKTVNAQMVTAIKKMTEAIRKYLLVFL